MSTTYLSEKLRERRRSIESARRHSRGVIIDVAEMLSPNDRLMVNKGIVIHVGDDDLTADLVDTNQNRVETVIISVNGDGELWLGSRCFGVEADSTEVYRAFADLIAAKIPIDQLLGN